MLCLRSRLESKFPSEQQVEQAKPVLGSPPAPPSGDRAGEAEMRCLRATLRGKSLADVASIKGSQACGRPAKGEKLCFGDRQDNMRSFAVLVGI